jgi:hypothetical protein
MGSGADTPYPIVLAEGLDLARAVVVCSAALVQSKVSTEVAVIAGDVVHAAPLGTCSGKRTLLLRDKDIR